MTAVWPSQVPHRWPINGVVPGQSYGAPVVSQTEGGPPLMRPRPGPRFTELPWRSLPLSAEQFTAFEQFARTTLRQGTLPFRMPVWKPDGCYVDRICQIREGTWSSDYSNLPWITVAFTLIVWNW